MQLTKNEWNRHAEIAAAHKHGENHVGWYLFRRYGAGPTAVLVVLGALALGARWLWTHARLPGAGVAGIPVAFWVLLVALILGTGVAFRPARTVRPAAATLVRLVVVGLLWLGLITYAVTVII